MVCYSRLKDINLSLEFGPSLMALGRDGAMIIKADPVVSFLVLSIVSQPLSNLVLIPVGSARLFPSWFISQRLGQVVM